MRKINKNTVSILVIVFMFTSSGITFAVPERGFNLRLPLKFNNLSLLNKIHSEVIREIKSHIEWLKKESEQSESEDPGIAGYLPLPAVRFLLDKGAKPKYEYNREKNEIVFYISADMNEKEFKKLCWLAYGNWFSKNEAGQHDYIYENYSDQLWPEEYLAYMKKAKYIDREEVSGKVILDAATGPGVPGILIAEQGAKKVTCLDVSKGMLREAEEKAAERNLHNVSFEQGSFFELRFADDSFDIVFANYAFNRNPVELRRIALQEILRVLKPGGKLKIYDIKGTDMEWSDSDWMEELGKSGYEKVEIVGDNIAFARRTILLMKAYKSQNSIASNAALLTLPCSDDELKKLNEIEGRGNLGNIRGMMSEMGKKKIISAIPVGKK